MQKSVLILILLFGLPAFANPEDWIGSYLKSKRCADLLIRPPSSKVNLIPIQFLAPLRMAYRNFLVLNVEAMSRRIRAQSFRLPLRESIPYQGKTLPVLGVLGFNRESVYYAVQTENGIRTIEECSMQDYPGIYAGLGRKIDLPVYGHDQQFLMMEYVMGLPEKLLTREAELDTLGIHDYDLATQIARWAESHFVDTDDVHDRDDVLLELPSGRVVHLSPYGNLK